MDFLQNPPQKERPDHQVRPLYSEHLYINAGGSARSDRTFGSKLRKRCGVGTSRNSLKNYGSVVNKQPGRGLRNLKSLLAEGACTE